LRSFLGCWEGFRKLGFSSDDLYCLVSKSVELQGGLGVYVHLKTQGKECNIYVGPVANSAEFHNQFKDVVQAVNSGEVTPEDLDRIWVESEVYQRRIEFVIMLEKKGFLIPKRFN